jgi:hypothetical protein
LPSEKRRSAWTPQREVDYGRQYFQQQGTHVAVVVGTEVFDLVGKKLYDLIYDLKGPNIYRPSGELVGHMNDARGSDKRLARSTDRMFPGHPLTRRA